MSGNEKVDYIHNDIELSRVLPDYSSSTNIRNNQQKILQHDYMFEMERNTPLTHMTINPNKTGEYNISTRTYNLADKPNIGGFEGKAIIPTFNRPQYSNGNELNSNQSDKVMFNKKVEAMFDRYRQ